MSGTSTERLRTDHVEPSTDTSYCAGRGDVLFNDRYAVSGSHVASSMLHCVGHGTRRFWEYGQEKGGGQRVLYSL